MKPTRSRESYLPKGSMLFHTGADTDTTVYHYPAPNNAPCALVFYGNARKPSLNFRFASHHARDLFIIDTLASRRLTVASIAKHKAERAQPHPLATGAVLVSVWGNEQTNVDFYQVVRVLGVRMVELRKIEQDRVSTGDMTGHCMPRVGEFAASAPPITKRADGTGSVKLSSYACARPWDGRRRAWSSYA